MKQYYYVDNNNQKIGPLSEDALKVLHQHGVVSSQTYIWTDGLEAWMPYERVFPVEEVSAQSVEEVMSQAAIEEDTVTSKASTAPLQQKIQALLRRKYILYLAGLGLVAILGGFTVVSSVSDSEVPKGEKKKVAKRIAKKITQEEAFEELRKYGIVNSLLDIEGKVGQRALREAAEQGNYKIVHYLVSGGAPVNSTYALEEACERGYMDIVAYLLQVPGIDVNKSAPLEAAARKGHTEVVKLLLAAPGIDVNKSAPLAAAARKGHTEVVKLLLAAPGIDVNYQSFHCDTPLHEAASNDHWQVVKLLLQAPGIKVEGDDKQILGAAIKQNDTELIKLLLAVPGMDINFRIKDEYGYYKHSPLHIAAIDNNIELLKMLLVIPGVDVNIASKGVTPLHFAAEKNHVEVVKLLLASPGIEVNKRNYYRGNLEGTPLLIAERHRNYECAELIRKAGGRSY